MTWSLKVESFVWCLYIMKDQYIGIFKTPEDALSFARRHYSNIQYHIEPKPVLVYVKGGR